MIAGLSEMKPLNTCSSQGICDVVGSLGSWRTALVSILKRVLPRDKEVEAIVTLFPSYGMPSSEKDWIRMVHSVGENGQEVRRAKYTEWSAQDAM
jgi:hypothetical protein